jgi:hemolysin III
MTAMEKTYSPSHSSGHSHGHLPHSQYPNGHPLKPYTGPERRKGPRLTQKAWRRQEIASSFTHGIATLFSIAGLWLLVVAAARFGNLRHLISFTVFGASLVILYGSSTFLHALPVGKTRKVFEDLDLAGIFLLIAGTYTPFTLVTLQGPLGWTLFGVIWALAIVGVIGMHYKKKAFERWASYIYLVMGWLIVLAIKPLAEHLPRPGLMLLVAGGVTYTLGVIFFLWERWLYHHVIWHLFVMLASLFHFLAILLYVLPDMRGGAWL